MTIRGKIALANPAKTEMTLQITMPLEDWQFIANAISTERNPGVKAINSYPVSRLWVFIVDLIALGEKAVGKTLDEAEEKR